MVNNLKVLRREGVRNCKEERALDFNSSSDKTRQNSFFFSNEKEVKLCKNRKRKRKR